MDDIGGERGGIVRGVEDVVANIGFPFRRSQVFVWGGDIQLLPQGRNVLLMTLYGLMRIWLAGVMGQVTPTFSMF